MSVSPISLSTVAQHNKSNDCWMVIEGSVYDVTKFLDEVLHSLCNLKI